MYFTPAVAAFAALSGLASAQTIHVVSVGIAGTKDLAFKPNSLKPAKGDMISFQFLGGNHSVAQSDFDNPCVPIASSSGGESPGIFSGYQPVDAGASTGNIPTWTMMVNSTDPMWLYCSASTHCQGGMAMVLNENPALNQSRTLDGYKQLAATAPQNIGGDGIVSGTIPTEGSTDGSETPDNTNNNNAGSSSSAAPVPTSPAGENAVVAPGTAAGHMVTALGAGWLLSLAALGAGFLVL